MKRLLTVVALLCMIVPPAFMIMVPPAVADSPLLPKNWSKNDWYNFLEYAVWTGLQGAQDLTTTAMKTVSRVSLTDAYSALGAMPPAMKAAMTEYLKGKMLEANDNNNLAALGKYQAYFTALSTEDNSALLQLQEEQQRELDRQKAEEDKATEAAAEAAADREAQYSSSSNHDLGRGVTTRPAATDLTPYLRQPPLDISEEMQKSSAFTKRVKQARTTLKTKVNALNAQRQRQFQQQQQQQYAGGNSWQDELRKAGSVLQGASPLGR